MIQRGLTDAARRAVTDTPVIFMGGARQVGKTTLARHLIDEGVFKRYLTFDDLTTLAAAQEDPMSFVRNLSVGTVLDEVQRVPEIFSSIKQVVDEDRTPGHFLITGSANVLLLPEVSDSLAGRVEFLELWPFSQGELNADRETFVSKLFDDSQALEIGDKPVDLASIVCRGGYPEANARSPDRRTAWFGSYLTAMLQRDVRDLAQIEGLSRFPRLLKILAARLTSLVNYSELSNASNIPQTTLKRYMALLEGAYLVSELPAWSSNRSKRLVKSPTLMFHDSGVAAYLQGISEERLATERDLFGPLLECFVYSEIRKQLSWHPLPVQIFHFRTRQQQEVDIVLEGADGRVVGIEVKAAGSLKTMHFKGLRALEDVAGEDFHQGIVLYTGDEIVSFGERLVAAPISTLWSPVGSL